ncbi:hypothetical protein D9613_005153 [Agrocybe pediades]|uniref:Major facilitator superfamily (MFS) profile domain-containing protein n=1 Tax=Agrocybe pediades TaxID=84607 RepID=A0A8H4QZS0_9AGAR|nr:hypothetical protein D9613_005153 [Agrocybe pediades]
MHFRRKPEDDVHRENMTEKEIDSSSFLEEVEAHRLSLRGAKLTAAIAFVTGTGFTLFGYDQGVMSSLLTAKQFEKTFPQVIVDGEHRNHATLQSLLVAIYEIGCLIGALSNLWIGDRLGRRRTIALGGIIMIVGAILQAASFSYAQILVARVITGLGNGLNQTSTVPSYHAECSPAVRRGSLIMIEGSLITFGITVAISGTAVDMYVRVDFPASKPLFTGYLKWLDFAFFWAQSSSVQWRAPVAIQIVFALIMVVAIGYSHLDGKLLLKAGRPAEAMAVISALEDKPTSDVGVRQLYEGIRDAVIAEGGSSLDNEEGNPSKGKVSLKELFTHGKTQNFRRVCLGIAIQCFQQITGINIITYYATLLFERLQISDTKSRIIAACNATEYLLASFIAIFLIDTVGRRKLMFFGSAGQAGTMILLAILGSINNSAARIVSAVMLFVFNSFFAVGWLGMAWLYPAEVVGLRMRGPANALSTASNWTFNFLVVMITGPAFENISWRTYISK